MPASTRLTNSPLRGEPLYLRASFKPSFIQKSSASPRNVSHPIRGTAIIIGPYCLGPTQTSPNVRLSERPTSRRLGDLSKLAS